MQAGRHVVLAHDSRERVINGGDARLDLSAPG
jgi:hypothetical protein